MRGCGGGGCELVVALSLSLAPSNELLRFVSKKRLPDPTIYSLQPTSFLL